MAPRRRFDGIEVVGRQRVGQDADHRIGQRRVSGVGDAKFKESRRNARIIGVERDERVEGVELHLAGEAVVNVGQLGQRIFATEIDALEVG